MSEFLSKASERDLWRRKLLFNFTLYQCFLMCSRTAWGPAKDVVKELRSLAKELGPHLPDLSKSLMTYLRGIIAQGTGDLDAALRIYEHPSLALPPATSKPPVISPIRDIAVLAILNRILILKHPSHPQHAQIHDLVAQISPHMHHTSNKYLKASNSLVRASMELETSLHLKHGLQHALEQAQQISNQHIIAIVLSLMTWRYFRGVVSPQAEKSARAARAMADKASNQLWKSVSNDMLADTLEKQGKQQDAQACKKEARAGVAALPEGVRSTYNAQIEQRQLQAQQQQQQQQQMAGQNQQYSQQSFRVET